MRVRLVSTSLTLLALLMSGCSTIPEVRMMVDAIGGAISENNSYILLPGNTDTSIEDLQFKEYAVYVNRALHTRGFVLTQSLENANVAIYLSYGIGNPKETQYSYSSPIFGQTGVSSSRTSGTTSSYGSYSGATTHTPSYGITGSTTNIESYTTYMRFMILDAVDMDEYKKSNKKVQIWKTTVTSEGASGDLREIFPVLVAASQRYVGKNTGRQVEEKMSMDDKRVIWIKGMEKQKNKRCVFKC